MKEGNPSVSCNAEDYHEETARCVMTLKMLYFPPPLTAVETLVGPNSVSSLSCEPPVGCSEVSNSK